MAHVKAAFNQKIINVAIGKENTKVDENKWKQENRGNRFQCMENIKGVTNKTE